MSPLLFLAAAALSLKAVWDLVPRAGSFPPWFVPAFAAGVAVLVLVAGSTALGLWRVRDSARPAGGRLAAGAWVLLALSFVCTSSVHQLYPFRLGPAAAYDGISPVLRFNLVLTGVGFLAAVGLGVLYARGRRAAALAGLVVLGLVLLVPNDDCANPFNEWWLATVGASPLMFLPNLYAILFGTAALLGVRPRFHLLALAGTCVGVALLGLGHMTRVIW
jgi:hypothetical protein